MANLLGIDDEVELFICLILTKVVLAVSTILLPFTWLLSPAFVGLLCKYSNSRWIRRQPIEKKQMFRLLITVQCWIEWMLATYYHWYNGSCPHVELIFLRFVDPDELPDIVYCFEEWEHIVSIVRLVCYYETDKFKDKQNKGIIITYQISLSSIEFGLFTLIGPSNLSNVGANLKKKLININKWQIYYPNRKTNHDELESKVYCCDVLWQQHTYYRY